MGLDGFIEIASVYGEEKKAVDLLERMLSASGCPESDLMDMRTALAEACLNAMEHGNKMDPMKTALVKIQVGEGFVALRVSDSGEGAVLKPLPGREDGNCRRIGEDSSRPGGFGLYLIDKLMDEWDYGYDPDTGQFWLRMVKEYNRIG